MTHGFYIGRRMAVAFAELFAWGGRGAEQAEPRRWQRVARRWEAKHQ